MSTVKQEAAKKIAELRAADPTLNLEALCKEHHISTSYYYNNYKKKPAKRAYKRALPVPAELQQPFVVPALQQVGASGSPLARAIVVIVPTADLPALIRQTFN